MTTTDTAPDTAMPAEIAPLTLEGAIWHYMDGKTVAAYGPWVTKADHDAALTAYKARAEAAEARVVELEKALEPFARVSSLFDHMNDDGGSVMVNIHLSDLRAARRALEGGE